MDGRHQLFPAFFLPVWSAFGGGQSNDPDTRHDGGARSRHCAFVPKKFYTVALELTSGFVASSRRISEKAAAEKLLAGCREEMVSTIQKITRKEKAENPPPLYDLTTLQRDANRLLGYSAQQTLDYVQSLYEKQLTTYPRTDSCYIADEDEEMLEELAEELEDFLALSARMPTMMFPGRGAPSIGRKSPTTTLSCLLVVCCKPIWMLCPRANGTF